MLRFLRKYSRSTGVKILYGLLAAIFLVWGVGVMGGDRLDLAARVYGASITRRDVDRQQALLEQRYESMRLPPELARALDLRGQALDQLIEQALLRREAERLGVGVTDADVVQAITRIPELQDNGRFNRERLETFLRVQRDRGEFEDNVRTGLLFERMRAVVTDGVAVAPAEVAARYHLDHDRMDLRVARITADPAAVAADLSDAELEQYLAENAGRYAVPAKVRARYVVFRRADFVAEVVPTDGEIAEYYELRKEDEFTEPEQVRARHILVRLPDGADIAARDTARKKAADLQQQAKTGADFAALARRHSEDPGSATQGGDLGLFPRGRMAPAFEEAAFALQPGQLSEVVETPFGFHVIKVEEHRPGGLSPLDAVREQIVEAIKGEKSLERSREAAEAVRKAVVGGKSLAEAAGGRPVAETEPFAASDAVPGVGRVKAFNETAFALEDGEVSDLVETDDAIYVLAPFGRVEAHTPPLAEVRERVAADARRARAEAAARARAEKLLSRAREVGLVQAAEEAGVAVEETGPFDRRTSPIPKLGAVPELVADALALTPEAPLAPKVYTTGGDAVVVALKERLPADEKGLEEARAGIRDSIRQQKQQAALAAWIDQLKQRAAQQGGLEVFANQDARG